MTALRFSIVIPTYQRREVVLRAVRALSKQEFDRSFEVIVVVDGSQDGTVEALKDLELPFPFKVLEQPNRGAATARNQGAAAAYGEILLFLDDDMIADHRLLAEHDRSHREGADVVMGHVPLHPETPPSIITPGVKTWAERRADRLTAAGASLTLQDMLTGQISVSREVFNQVMGFDVSFTQDGSFGNEDVDFGYRLLRGGFRIVFNPDAISWQYYVVQPCQYLRQWHQAGSADVIFARKHPEQVEAIFSYSKADAWMNKQIWRRIANWPILGDLLIDLLDSYLLWRLGRGDRGHFTIQFFRQLKRAEYWRGVHKAGGIPERRPLLVLAYHAIADLSGIPVLERYGVPPEVFRQQLDALLQAGFRFVDAGEVLRFLNGSSGLPRRAILLTFDDCYEELLDVVLPILQERGIPAIAFAVSALLGKTNDWDQTLGRQLRLLDIHGLRELARAGIEIGAHSRTHQRLTRLTEEELPLEVAGSIADLESLGIKRARFFAYPYGESDPRVRQAVRKAGVKAAFTVDPYLARPGVDPYQVPRIEILRSDIGRKFLWKIARSGRSVAPLSSLRLRPREAWIE